MTWLGSQFEIYLGALEDYLSQKGPPPEMFAEWREPANPYIGSTFEAFLKEEGINEPDLPPGPAFIPLPRWLLEVRTVELIVRWVDENIPPGYHFKPATEYTGAGWVRPHGEPK